MIKKEISPTISALTNERIVIRKQSYLTDFLRECVVENVLKTGMCHSVAGKTLERCTLCNLEYTGV